MAKVAYKPPGAEEWQVLELVVDRAHHQVWALCGPNGSERKFQALPLRGLRACYTHPSHPRFARSCREAVRKAGEPQGMDELLAAMFKEPVPRRAPEDPGESMSEAMRIMLGGRSTEDVLQEMLGITRRRR